MTAQSPFIDTLIAMGSNLGDRRAHLLRACDALANHSSIEDLKVSSFVETEPVGGPAQGPYLNGAVRFETRLDGEDLLSLLMEIERRHRRVRTEINGPRTLDLDLILWGDRIVNKERLTVPHPRAHLRRFVLEPAAEVASDMIFPTLDQSVGELLEGLAAPHGRLGS